MRAPRPRKIGQALTCPIYIHFGQTWAVAPKTKDLLDPERDPGDMLEILRRAMILAGLPSRGHPGGASVDRHGHVTYG